MRIITDQMTNDMLSSYLLRNRDTLHILQQQISSGRRVLRPSYDPGSYDLISRLHDRDVENAQYMRNAERLMENLVNHDYSLQRLANILHRTSELTIIASDGTKSPQDIINIGQEMNQMLEDLVQVANTRINEYQYAGLRSDEPAYVVTRDADGFITDVTYQGDDETHMVEIGRGMYVPSNLIGTNLTSDEAVFQSRSIDLFADFINLRDRMMNGENLVRPDMVDSSGFNDATNVITVNNTYTTGSTIQLSSEGTLPGGLTAGTTYYVISVSATEIQLAATLDDARNGIAIDFAGSGTGQHTLTQQNLGDIERDLEHVMALASRVGAYEERVDIQKTTLLNESVEIAQRLEDEESVDLAKAMMELSSKQVAYEAALKISSSFLNVSLLNYI